MSSVDPSAPLGIRGRSRDPSRPPRASTGFERRLLRRILEELGSPAVRAILWDGSEIRASGEAPVATMRLADRATLFGLLARPELAFGDAYAEGRITVDGDFVRLLETVFRASPDIWFLPRWLRVRRTRRNTLFGSKRNIHHHYDIGNDFYRLWLDEEMVYTCAYFHTPEVSLEDAQRAKMDHVCRKVALRPGERVVEAGCGWGSLALHMARHYGVTVRAYNISHEQILYAREAAARAGLEDRVEYVEDDYRNIAGTYDVFMSVGMLEHVGKENYRRLGAVIDRCLTDAGRGLVHTIGRNRPSPTSEWIARRIFPGAYIPSLGEMMEIFEPRDLSVLDVENLRLHYALTLRHWLDRFEKSAAEIARRFDERFVRAWRLYLSSSIAAFLSGGTQLFQVVFARGRTNEIPWTRERVYVGADA
jgi:cyclopropane-fatty-acyl-phospholipid synthase